MKIRLKPSLAALSIASAVAMPVMAASTPEAALKKPTDAKTIKLAMTDVSHATHEDIVHHKSKSKKKTLNKEDTRVGYAMSGEDLRDLIEHNQDILPVDLDVPGRGFVSTGPYTGVPFQFAGNDLIINSPSVDRDVQLLTIRKAIAEHLHDKGLRPSGRPQHSHLLLSGVVEGVASYNQRTGQSDRSDIDLGSASADLFFMGPSEWLLGFLEFTYSPVTPATDVFGGASQYRVSNSRLYVNMGFFTIGNFAKSPFYATVGQYYVPFGVYSSVMVSSPVTKVLGRTKARALLLGYQQQNADNKLYAATYIFRGDSRVSAAGKVNNGGINLGYKFKTDMFKGKVGAGVIANIADSGGIQTGANIQNAERLVHRVPGYDVRALVNVGSHFDFIGEFVTASTSFNPNDMSFNGRGAKPWAFDLETAYSMDLFEEHPSSLGIGYSQTHEALALGLPLNRISVALNTSIWRNTLQSIEFRRDLQYAGGNTASGGGEPTPAASGRIDRAVTAQFDYYF